MQNTIKPYSFSNFGIDNKFDDFSKQVCIFIDGIWFEKEEYKNSDYRVLISGCEPPEIFNEHYTEQQVIVNHQKFDLILTSHTQVLEKCSNAVLFPFGSSWISSLPTDYVKQPILSFLCGAKQFLTGHQLRHQIFQIQDQIQGSLTKQFLYSHPGDRKSEWLYPAMFTIVVENSQHENYFTEKIVDCLLAKSIPIYWGCTNIDKYFDMRGVIKFNTLEELVAKCNAITPAIYESRKEFIEKNYQTALYYKNFHKRVSDEISKRLQ